MNSDNIEMTLTVEESLNKMYNKAIDHAIAIVNDGMLDVAWNKEEKHFNSILSEMVENLQNLKSK